MKAGTQRVAGKIVGINSDERSIVVNDAQKGLQRLHIDKETKFQRDGKAATWADLKVGEKVKAAFRDEGGKVHAETLELEAR